MVLGNFFDDFYEYDIQLNQFNKLNATYATGVFPSARSGLGMTSTGENIFVFGGNTSSGLFQ